MATTPVILTINCGSSSLKFALFGCAPELPVIMLGAVKEIGRESQVHISGKNGETIRSWPEEIADMAAGIALLVKLLKEQFAEYVVHAIGHRLVQGGMHYSKPEKIDDTLLAAITGLIPLAPAHLPSVLTAIRTLGPLFPDVLQVACFDTAFHRQLPFEAQHYALPRELWKEGVIRYGFHGLSFEYILQQLQETAPEIAGGRLIIAHLGNGASMAAVHEGKSRDTTMGLTPAGGLVMSTRSGDLDPGVLLYLLQEKKMDAAAISKLLHKESGLKAVSGTTADIQQLLEMEKDDDNAAAAISLFCYQAVKFAGALAAVLGGLDAFIFTGGIGEHAPAIRQRICNGLHYLGAVLDEKANEEQRPVISGTNSAVSIRVITTNEELVIAQHTYALLQHHEKTGI